MFGSVKKKASSSNDAGRGLFSWLGNLAVFYVTLLALISIPFLVLALILFFRTVMDYHVWILAGITAITAVTLLFFIRRRKQIREQFEAEKKDVMEIIRSAAR